MSSISINLPQLNGSFETGIAISTERSIEDKLKLNVINAYERWDDRADRSKDKPVKYAIPTDARGTKLMNDLTLLALYTQCGDDKKDDFDTTLLVSGAAALIQTGMICHSENDKDRPDGAWKFSTAQPFEVNDSIRASIARIVEICSPENMKKAMTMVVAMKVNWFKENHHVGQDQSNSGAYFKKVLRATYGDKSTTAESKRDTFHRLGHWASTREVLRCLKVDNIIEVTPVFKSTATILGTDDVSLRLKSMPAGTGRLSIAYNLAIKMLMHPTGIFVPNPHEYAGLYATVQRIKLDPAKYHIGGDYLCGARAAYDDNVYESLLGRVGTFGTVYMPKSTLMASPHAKKYLSASDYDADYYQMLRAFRAARDKQLQEKLKIFSEINVLGSSEYEVTCEGLNIKPNGEAINVLSEIIKREKERKELEAKGGAIPKRNEEKEKEKDQDESEDEEEKDEEVLW